MRGSWYGEGDKIEEKVADGSVATVWDRCHGVSINYIADTPTIK